MWSSLNVQFDTDYGHLRLRRPFAGPEEMPSSSAEGQGSCGTSAGIWSLVMRDCSHSGRGTVN